MIEKCFAPFHIFFLPKPLGFTKGQPPPSARLLRFMMSSMMFCTIIYWRTGEPERRHLRHVFDYNIGLVEWNGEMESNPCAAAAAAGRAPSSKSISIRLKNRCASF